MNDQQWAMLIRLVLGIMLAPSSYLVMRGVLTADEADKLIPVLVPAIMTVGGLIIGKFSFDAHSASSLVAAVNSDAVPGVKVVALSSPSPAVSVEKTGEVKVLPA